MTTPTELAGLVEEVAPLALELRRRLHTRPEPSHREETTTRLISEALAAEGLDLVDRSPRTGGWVDIGPVSPTVGFRADIDALPIQEPIDNDPRSANEGWMHACGHDAHAAIAYGIAAVINRAGLSGGARVIFQPGEEANPGGAVELVAEGALEGLDNLIAFHVDPALRVGRVGSRVGPITGSADSLTVAVHGPGGHTSRPHKTVDLVDAAARIVADLPHVLRRSIDARSPIVTAFGSIHGGDAPNVIPTEIIIKGTVRTLDPGVWDLLPGLVDKAIGSILAISGAGYTLEYQQGIPPVVNDEYVVTTATSAMTTALGSETVVPTEQSMGGEDFSNYLSSIPGAMFRLGSASGGGDLHSAGFKLNEDAVPFGIHAGAAALVALLGR